MNKMKVTTVSHDFEEYWRETKRNREGYPPELIDLLKRHERAAFLSAVQSAGNLSYIAAYDLSGDNNTTAKVFLRMHDAIWGMKTPEDVLWISPSHAGEDK